MNTLLQIIDVPACHVYSNIQLFTFDFKLTGDLNL